MLKGINKQILEVTNTESPYFERIVFFVRPDKNTVSEAAQQSIPPRRLIFLPRLFQQKRAEKAMRDRLR